MGMEDEQTLAPACLKALKSSCDILMSIALDFLCDGHFPPLIDSYRMMGVLIHFVEHFVMKTPCATSHFKSLLSLIHCLLKITCSIVHLSKMVMMSTCQLC